MPILDSAFDVKATKVITQQDLVLGAKSLALTLAAGVGSCPIPDEATYVWVNPATGAVCRVGLEAPEADGAKSGDAALTDLKKGIPVTAVTWTKFTLPLGSGRVLYVKGGATDVIEIVVI